MKHFYLHVLSVQNAFKSGVQARAFEGNLDCSVTCSHGSDVAFAMTQLLGAVLRNPKLVVLDDMTCEDFFKTR